MGNTSLHKSGTQLGAVTFHKEKAALNLFKCLNSVQAPEICTMKLTFAGETLRARGSSAHAHHEPYCMDFNCPSRSTLHPTLVLEVLHLDDIHGLPPSLASGWVLPIGITGKSSGGQRKLRLRCPLAPPQSHHELVVSLYLRYLSHAFSVSRFCNCPVPHCFRRSNVNGLLLLLALDTAPFLTFPTPSLYFIIVPFIKLFSNYPIHICHLFIA